MIAMSLGGNMPRKTAGLMLGCLLVWFAGHAEAARMVHTKAASSLSLNSDCTFTSGTPTTATCTAVVLGTAADITDAVGQDLDQFTVNMIIDGIVARTQQSTVAVGATKPISFTVSPYTGSITELQVVDDAPNQASFEIFRQQFSGPQQNSAGIYAVGTFFNSTGPEVRVAGGGLSLHVDVTISVCLSGTDTRTTRASSLAGSTISMLFNGATIIQPSLTFVKNSAKTACYFAISTEAPFASTEYVASFTSDYPIAALSAGVGTTLVATTTAKYSPNTSSLSEKSSAPVTIPAPTCQSLTPSRTTVLSGETFQLTAACTLANTYTFTGPGVSGGSSSSTTITVTAPLQAHGPQPYTVTAKNIAGKPSTSISTTVTVVSPTPVCQSISQTPNPVGLGKSVTLTATCSNSPATYVWTNTATGAVAGTGQSLPVTAVAGAQYSVVATNDGGSSSPLPYTLIVVIPPVCQSISQAPNPVGTGQSVILTATCSNNPDTYAWTNTATGAVAGTGQALTVPAIAGAQYSVVATNVGGSSPPLTYTLNTVNKPVCQSISQDPNPVGPGQAVRLTATCSSNAASYAWTNTVTGAVAGTGQSLTVTAAAGGQYSVVASNIGGSSAPLTFALNIAGPPQCSVARTAPTGTVQIGDTVTLAATCPSVSNPSAVATYAWSSPSGSPIGSNQATVSFQAPAGGGTYKVSVTNAAALNATFTYSLTVAQPAIVSTLINALTTVTVANGQPTPLSVKLTNSATGAPLPNVVVTWTASAGAGTLANATTTTGSDGVATNSFTPAAGVTGRTVTASVAGASVKFEIKDVVKQIDEPSKQITAPLLQTAIAAPQAQLANVRARLDQLRLQRATPTMVDVRVSAQGTDIPFDTLTGLLRDNDKTKSGKSGGAGASGDSFERWGLFVNGNVEIGRYDPKSAGQGNDLRSRGITAGVDYRFDNNAVLGTGLGVFKGTADLFADGGNQDSKGTSLSVYGSVLPTEKSYVDLTLNYGRNKYDTRRNVFDEVGASLGTAASSTKGNQLAVGAAFGLDLVSGSFRFNPFGRLEYIRATIDAFAESGSQQNLGIGSQEVKSKAFTVGAQANYAISTSWAVVLPTARVEWSWSSRDVRAGVLAALVSDPTNSRTIDAPLDDHTYGNAGLGVTLQFPSGVSCFLNYEQLIAKEFTTNRRWDFGVRIPF